MDTHLVLNAAHVDTTVALVVDEHRETTTVLATLLATCEHQMDVTHERCPLGYHRAKRGSVPGGL